MENVGVYCIENLVDGKKYIGQSKNITKRWQTHRYKLNNNMHYNQHLQSSWNKYGKTNFKFYIIEKCDIKFLNECEKNYIKYFNSNNRDFGFNKDLGGGCLKEISKETKNKISSSHIGMKYSSSTNKLKGKKGENNYFYGQTLGDSINAIPVSQYNKQGGLINNFSCAKEAYLLTGVDSSCITKCCKEKRQSAGGYVWKYTRNISDKSAL